MLFTGLRFDSVSDQIKEDCHAEQDFNQNYTAVAPFLFLMFFCYQKRIFSYWSFYTNKWDTSVLNVDSWEEKSLAG